MSEEKDLTVKAKANEEDQGCTCPCAQPLENYVLTVDFVNALQNIRNMINDAINNVDLSEIYKKLIKEIQAALEDVWKHVGLIQGPNNKIEEAKSILNGLPESQLRQGDTRILTYNKEIHNNDGTTTTKQMNDLYVYLNQKMDPNSTESESEKKKWMKIVTTEFTMDGSGGEDINLDDIIRRLEKLEDSIAEIIKIVTSIWAYLCKNWWEFVDTAETIAEIEEKTDATIAQNYYCKEDNNIYVYLKIGGTENKPEMDWIPLLNAENLPYYQNAWRHTQVVSANAADLGTGEFIGETKFWLKDSNIYVWLPTTEGAPGGSPQWVPLLTNFNKNAWVHTKTVSAKPTDTGRFIGETRYSTNQEEKTEYDGDVFVWLPSKLGGPNNVGTDPKWFNITRNKSINDIKNYNPEYVQIDISFNQCSKRLRDACNSDVFGLNGKRIERYGQMVNVHLGYGRGVKLLHAYNKETGGAYGSSYQKDHPHTGWQAIYDAYTKYAFFNRSWGDKMCSKESHKEPRNAWSGNNDSNYIDNFTFLDMSNLFLGYLNPQVYALPTSMWIDGVNYTAASRGKQKIEELLKKYKIKNTQAGYIELARRFFAPSVSLEYTGYCECWPGNAPKEWRNACYNATGAAKVTAMYNVGGYLDPNINTTNAKGMYRHITDNNLMLYDVNHNIPACSTSDMSCTSITGIRNNGIIDSPFVPTNVTSIAGWGTYWGFRPYCNRIHGSHVGRSMAAVIDPSAVL